MKNTRYSSSSTTIETKPEMGTFQCCQCSFTLQIEFWQPVVPEYLLSSVKRRKTGSNSALNLLNRNKDTNLAFATGAYSTLATYVNHRLNGGTRDINTLPDSPFARRLGSDPDVIRFMEYLGWTRDDNQMLHPPLWDEELDKGRLRRKLLEAAEIELTQLAMETGKDVDKADKPSINLKCSR